MQISTEPTHDANVDASIKEERSPPSEIKIQVNGLWSLQFKGV